MSEWVEKRLGEICEIEIGGTPSRSVQEYWDNSNATENFWVSIRDMNQRVIRSTSERITDLGILRSNAKKVRKGTVLLSFKLSIGKVGIAGFDLYTNEAIAALRTQKINNDYLYYGLQHWDLLQNVDSAIKGATLNKEKLDKIRVHFPTDPAEQARIAKILSTVDAAIEQTEDLIAKYSRIRTGLMQDLLVRGDKLPQVPLSQLADVSAGITLGKKVYFWHSTGPSGGSFVGLAISKFAIPVLFLYSRTTLLEPCNKAIFVRYFFNIYITIYIRNLFVRYIE